MNERIMPEDLRKESEELLRYFGELVRRIGHGGITDIAQLVALYEQLKRALGSVSTQELVWADEQARRLAGKLDVVSRGLEAMRQLKSRLEDTDNDPGGSEPTSQ